MFEGFTIEIERVVKFATYGVAGSQRFKPPRAELAAERKERAKGYTRKYERNNRAKRSAQRKALRKANPERFRNYTRRHRQKAKEGR
jgi:hypothetical protein